MPSTTPDNPAPKEWAMNAPNPTASAGTRSAMGAPPGDAAATGQRRVLIVDTDAEATEMLATLLRLSSPDITTACAHTARAAVALAQDFQPHVAIIDLGTQATSGVVIAGAVLAGCAGVRPLMIALTAKGLQGGGIRPPRIFDHVLPKPLELRALMTVIAQRDEPARH